MKIYRTLYLTWC